MAREAYRSLYGDLTKLKDDSLLKDPAAGAGDDNEMFQLLLAVSDWIDHHCNWHFYPRTQTLEFDGNGSARLLIPDLISLTSLSKRTPPTIRLLMIPGPPTTIGWNRTIASRLSIGVNHIPASGSASTAPRKPSVPVNSILKSQVSGATGSSKRTVAPT